jgi:putative addiction module killer protein
MEVQPKEIRYYVTEEEFSPFTVWFKTLRDGMARNKIEIRLKRIELGNMGDCKFVGEGVYELRIDTGPGYRIYFGQVDDVIIMLLCGGDKSSQDKDIQLAQKYWRDYESNQD